MKKVFVALAVTGVLAVVATLATRPPEVNLAPYLFLRSPRIAQRVDERVVQVVVKGDPEETSRAAIALLYRVFMGLDGAREMLPVAPKARWPIAPDTPREAMVGHFALAVPRVVQALPANAQEDGLRAELTTWTYGDVAEILHVGAYDDLRHTIERLETFIEERGYIIAGPQEEEYLKGPGMLFRGDPARYHTVIRYNVRRKPEPRVPLEEPR